MQQRGRGGKRWATGATGLGGVLLALGVLINLAALLALSPANALAGSAWNVSTLSLPADAKAGNSGAFESVSCAAVGDCGTTGTYEDSSGRQEAMVASEAGGTWGAATKVTLPPDATRTWADGELVECAGAGSCTATGEYFGSSGTNERPMAFSESSGTWGNAEQLLLPADASLEHPKGAIYSMSCPMVGNCVAVGSYIAGENETPMVVSETGGVWGTATKLTLPADAATELQLPETIGSVSCGAVGFCSAVGRYEDNEGHLQAVTVNESSGVWGAAKQLPLPVNAAVGHIADLEEVDCLSEHFCQAIGGYFTVSGEKRPMAVSEADGVWGAPQELTMPSAAVFAGFRYSVSCSAPGFCAAGGDYLDSSEQSHAWIASEMEGTWGPASTVTPPSDVSPIEPLAYISAVSCHEKGACDAVGGYSNGESEQLMATTEEEGVWSGGTNIKLALPGGALGGLSPGAVSCPASHHCVVVSGNAVTTETPGSPPVEHDLTVAKGGTGAGSVSSAPGGINCGSTCSHGFNEGMVVTLTATPAAGSTFAGWSGGGCSGTGACQLSLAADVKVTATFTASEGNASGSPPSGALLAAPSEAAPLPSSPKPRKPLHCRKGSKKQRFHGKAKCVRVKKSNR